MKAVLLVYFGTSTAVLDQISSAVQEACPGVQLRYERRTITEGTYKLDLDPEDVEVDTCLAAVIEAAVKAAGMAWCRTYKSPTSGMRYPRPLKETAEAYRRSEDARASTDRLREAGICPMQHLLDQER